KLRTFAGLFCMVAALAITTQASADNGTIHVKAVNDPLGSQGSAVNNINSLGIVVGSYTDASGVYHGFVSTPPHSKGTFTTIDGPDAPPLTEVWGINLEGVVTGHYQDA